MPVKILADKLGLGENWVSIDTDLEAARMLQLWAKGYRVVPTHLLEARSQQPAAADTVDLTLGEPEPEPEPKPKRSRKGG